MRYLKKYEEKKHIKYIIVDGKSDGIKWLENYLFCVSSIELEIDGNITYYISNYYIFDEKTGKLYNESAKTIYYKNDLNILYETEDLSDALYHFKMFNNTKKYNI